MTNTKDSTADGLRSSFGKKLSVIFLTLIFSITALADQAAYITKAEADKAVALLKTQKEVKHFCALCEDKGVYTESIEKVQAAPTGYENTWQVFIRDEGDGLDLAYVYFKDKKGKWKNVAKELGIKVDGVPKFLPDDKK